MLKVLSPFLFSLLLYSCNNITKPSYFDGMLPTDTSCIKEMQKAKEDLMYQKLVYCHYDGMLSHNISRQDDILDSLFYKYGIIVKYESIGCFVEEDKKQHCYCEYMNIIIEQKHGDRFVDSLEALTDSIYLAEQSLSEKN